MRHWASLEQRDGGAAGRGRAHGETPEHASPEASRRDFLRLAGFTAIGALGASCGRAPVRQAIPHVSQPIGLVPGGTSSYATTCGGCSAGCGLLVTSRDGRPIKIEGMPDHPLSAGGICAVGQASLLGLYDNRRFRSPKLAGADVAWAALDADLGARFDAIRRAGGKVRVLTPTVHGPAARRAIAGFLATFADGGHVEYDTHSAAAALDAHETTHGVRALPRYRFDRADVIVSFDADFLGTWVSPTEYTAAWAQRRRPAAGRAPLWHAQLEGRLSLTGGKADRRVPLAPDEIAAIVYDVAALVETSAPGDGLAGDLAARLREARGRSIVVSGIQDRDVQILCNRVNEALGNYGATLDLARPSLQRQGDDGAVERLLQQAARGEIAALLAWRVNPLFDLPGGDRLAQVPLLVSFAERPDETSGRAHAICPDHHTLESWSDAEPVAGLVGMAQPLVEPLGQTRAFVESLAVWQGTPRDMRAVVQDAWRETVFPRQHAEADFDRFWTAAVRAGHVMVDPQRPAPAARPPRTGAMVRPAVAADALHLVLHQSPAILGGEHAYNPLLLELPDPITKTVWDNVACISEDLAARLGLTTGAVARIEVSGGAVELPVLVQAGQHARTISVPLGYGGVQTERFKDLGHHWFGSRPTVGPHGRVGVNAAPLLAAGGGLVRFHRADVRIAATDRRQALACTQTYHSLDMPAHLAPRGGERRPIVQEVAAADLAHAPGPSHGVAADLWPDDHAAKGHRWGMAIDLNACTGCGACVVACQVENNIPVVGKDEVGRNREMHWLRIDRYFSEDQDGVHVAHQPMFCQHCGHAPCETVCPTLATVHSAEGLNQQVYNRCVGTRYCANNCPYKARRFNWFEYPHGDGVETLALNPDVTVRVRGVMEKCTMCVQRIQEGKIDARRRGVPVADGDIRTACQQSCPARAIVFGDLNDPASAVARHTADRRAYHVLEELNVKPSVAYLKIVRHAEVPDEGNGSHG